ncbi:hypothetical protein PGH47_22910 [Streptomyces sp. HUAS 31]|uniref:hypothetical protein n=1 Tax=Streptomyces TaxID=1883 RepID=UPI002304E403|nr:hypothetical protein [Streptomyces sp. HUAS 31]WCD98358.1 hypothetical protein PGH47_22910 [Streptomyces sp. HUAS 31]
MTTTRPREAAPRGGPGRGSLADRIGARPVLLGGLIAFALATLTHGYAALALLIAVGPVLALLKSARNTAENTA